MSSNTNLGNTIPEKTAQQMRQVAAAGEKNKPVVQASQAKSEANTDAVKNAAAAAVAEVEQHDHASLEGDLSEANTTGTVSEAEAAAAQAAARAEDAKAAKATVYSKLGVTVMLTLDLTNPFFDDNSGAFKSLSKFKPEGSEEVVNLFHLFRGVPAKDKDKGIARGLMRSALKSVFSVAAEFEGSNVMLLGTRNDVYSHVRNATNAICERVRQSLGVDAEEQVLALEGNSIVRFSDLISVSSWFQTAGSTLDTKAGPDASVTAGMFVNIKINSPALYESADPDKMVTQIRNFISGLIRKEAESLGGYEPNILFAVAMRGSSVFEEARLDLIQSFAADKDTWEVYDRKDLYSLVDGESDWAPNSKSGVDNALLPSSSADMLFLTQLPVEEVEGE